MWFAFIWIVVCSLLALWSFVAWAVHGIGTWALNGAGGWSGAGAGAEALHLPTWLEAWLPAGVGPWLLELASQAAPFLDGVLQAMPLLAGGLTVATWVVWALVSLTLLVLGAIAHLLVVAWRRSGGPSVGTLSSMMAR